MRLLNKEQSRKRRHARVRAVVSGTASIPRLNVYRSLSGMYIQLVDDEAGKTLLSVNSKKDVGAGDVGERKGSVAKSYLLGLALSEKAKIQNIKKIVFDRGGYQYHGRVQAVADGARDGGLEF